LKRDDDEKLFDDPKNAIISVVILLFKRCSLNSEMRGWDFEFRVFR